MIVHRPQVLAIIGQGYVGLPLAMAAVDAGWTVIGIDNFAAKVAQINGGSSPVEDISDEQLQAAISKGAYKVSIDFSMVAQASVVTMCVPTPLDQNRKPDLTLLRSAAAGIAPYISNETLVVSESTSYPGTLRDIIIPIVNQLKPDAGVKVYFACSPERVNPGDVILGDCDGIISLSPADVMIAAKLGKEKEGIERKTIKSILDGRYDDAWVDATLKQKGAL